MLGMFAATLLPLVSATPSTKILTVRDLAPFEVRDAAARQVSSAKTVAALAKQLFALAPTPLERARAAYVWTTSHIAYALVRHPSADATLAAGNGNCEAHTVLYGALCDAMGVRCSKVTGYLRFPYDPGAALADSTKRLAPGQWLVAHAWNAICIDGRWGLVDTTLGTPEGAVEPDEYFLVDPTVMATDHVPDDPAQALVAAIPLDKLAKTPLLRPSAWRMNFDAADLIAKPGSDGSNIFIHLPWNHDMRVALQTDAGSAEDAALVQPQSNASGTEIHVCSPKNGAVAWLGIGSGGSWRPLAGYPVEGSTAQRLPTLMTRFYDSNSTLIGPFKRDLPAGQTTEIRLRAPGASRVIAFQGPEVAGMFERDSDDTWVLRTTPTSGPALQIMASYENRNHFQGLLSYKVR